MVMKRYAFSELHISTVSGFTPSAATLAAVSKSGTFNPTNLTPGTTYYYRILHRDLRGLVGQATPEQSFVAGYTQLAHIDPNLRQSMHAFLSAPVTFNTNLSQFAIPFDTADYDPQGNFDATHHGFKTLTGGVFDVRAGVAFGVTSGVGLVTPGSVATLQVVKNGGIVIGDAGPPGVVVTNPTNGLDSIPATIATIVTLAPNDYIQICVFSAPIVLNVIWNVFGLSAGGSAMSVVQLLG